MYIRLVTQPPLAPGRYIAALDAMRGERYAQHVAVQADGAVRVEGADTLASPELLARGDTVLVGPLEAVPGAPHARGVAVVFDACLAAGPVDLDAWEPSYGRLAEAQVKWEAAHGRPLSTG